jgi:hypothetical protein
VGRCLFFMTPYPIPLEFVGDNGDWQLVNLQAAFPTEFLVRRPPHNRDERQRAPFETRPEGVRFIAVLGLWGSM